jgi:hypothetical protein
MTEKDYTPPPFNGVLKFLSVVIKKEENVDQFPTSLAI